MSSSTFGWFTCSVELKYATKCAIDHDGFSSSASHIFCNPLMLYIYLFIFFFSENEITNDN